MVNDSFVCTNTPSDFPENCIGENLLKKNTVAYLGNTDSGIIQEYDFLETYLKELFTQNVYNIGKLHDKILPSLSGYPHRFHLLGDPETPVWTNVPQNLDVTVTPTTRIVASWQNPTTIKVKVNNLPAGETATVCIMKDTDLSEYEDKCDKCEDLGQECPTLVASHEINLSANELDECLKDYKKDLNWAEVVNLI